MEDLVLFCKTVNEEYQKQESSQEVQTTTELKPLASMLHSLKDFPIFTSEEDDVFKCLLKYIEIALSVINNISSLENKQIGYIAKSLLTVVPGILHKWNKEEQFVQKYIDDFIQHILYHQLNVVSKKLLFKMMSRILSCSTNKQVSVDIANKHVDLAYTKYKLLDTLSTYGSYELQLETIEIFFRIFGHHVKNKKLTYVLIPTAEHLGRSLTEDVNIKNFDDDVRHWLNEFNDTLNSKFIFSIPCEKVMLGKSTFRSSYIDSIVWVDFDLKDDMISMMVKETEEWNYLTILNKHVKNIRILRESLGDEPIVAMTLSKPPINRSSSFKILKNDWVLEDYNFKMYIKSDEKKRYNKLILEILPKYFRNVFSHSTHRVSAKKPGYKPLRRPSSSSASSTSSIRSSTTVRHTTNSVGRTSFKASGFTTSEMPRSSSVHGTSFTLDPSSDIERQSSLVSNDKDGLGNEDAEIQDNIITSSARFEDTSSIEVIKDSTTFQTAHSNSYKRQQSENNSIVFKNQLENLQQDSLAFETARENFSPEPNKTSTSPPSNSVEVIQDSAIFQAIYINSYKQHQSENITSIKKVSRQPRKSPKLKGVDKSSRFSESVKSKFERELKAVTCQLREKSTRKRVVQDSTVFETLKDTSFEQDHTKDIPSVVPNSSAVETRSDETENNSVVFKNQLENLHQDSLAYETARDNFSQEPNKTSKFKPADETINRENFDNKLKAPTGQLKEKSTRKRVVQDSTVFDSQISKNRSEKTVNTSQVFKKQLEALQDSSVFETVVENFSHKPKKTSTFTGVDKTSRFSESAKENYESGLKIATGQLREKSPQKRNLRDTTVCQTLNDKPFKQNHTENTTSIVQDIKDCDTRKVRNEINIKLFHKQSKSTEKDSCGIEITEENVKSNLLVQAREVVSVAEYQHDRSENVLAGDKLRCSREECSENTQGVYCSELGLPKSVFDGNPSIEPNSPDIFDCPTQERRIIGQEPEIDYLSQAVNIGIPFSQLSSGNTDHTDVTTIMTDTIRKEHLKDNDSSQLSGKFKTVGRKPKRPIKTGKKKFIFPSHSKNDRSNGNNECTELKEKQYFEPAMQIDEKCCQMSQNVEFVNAAAEISSCDSNSPGNDGDRMPEKSKTDSSENEDQNDGNNEPAMEIAVEVNVHQLATPEVKKTAIQTLVSDSDKKSSQVSKNVESPGAVPMISGYSCDQGVGNGEQDMPRELPIKDKGEGVKSNANHINFAYDEIKVVSEEIMEDKTTRGQPVLFPSDPDTSDDWTPENVKKGRKSRKTKRDWTPEKGKIGRKSLGKTKCSTKKVSKVEEKSPKNVKNTKKNNNKRKLYTLGNYDYLDELFANPETFNARQDDVPPLPKRRRKSKVINFNPTAYKTFEASLLQQGEVWSTSLMPSGINNMLHSNLLVDPVRNQVQTEKGPDDIPFHFGGTSSPVLAKMEHSDVPELRVSSPPNLPKINILENILIQPAHASDLQRTSQIMKENNENNEENVPQDPQNFETDERVMVLVQVLKVLMENNKSKIKDLRRCLSAME